MMDKMAVFTEKYEFDDEFTENLHMTDLMHFVLASKVFFVAVCCSMLHYAALCCTVLHCVALCCTALNITTRQISCTLSWPPESSSVAACCIVVL